MALSHFVDQCRSCLTLDARLGDRLRLATGLLLDRAQARCPWLAWDPVWQVEFRKNSVAFKVPVRPSSVYALDVTLVHEQYSFALSSPKTILDLGANIGYATLYLSRRYPGAEIAAVEPHPANAALFRATAAMNGLDVELFEAAVDPVDGNAELILEGSTRHRIAANEAGRPSLRVQCISVPSLLKRLQWQSVDLVKIDIEGHERALFQNGRDWLPRTGAIIGELHGAYSIEEVTRELRPFGFAIQTRQVGNETIFSATRDVPPAP